MTVLSFTPPFPVQLDRAARDAAAVEKRPADASGARGWAPRPAAALGLPAFRWLTRVKNSEEETKQALQWVADTVDRAYDRIIAAARTGKESKKSAAGRAQEYDASKYANTIDRLLLRAIVTNGKLLNGPVVVPHDRLKLLDEAEALLTRRSAPVTVPGGRGQGPKTVPSEYDFTPEIALIRSIRTVLGQLTGAGKVTDAMNELLQNRSTPRARVMADVVTRLSKGQTPTLSEVMARI